MPGWALDLGTTNSGVARWDDSGQPQLVELVAVCRKPERDDPLEAPRLVPSAVHFLERPGRSSRLASWPPLARRLFLGQRALIGRPALDRNDGDRRTAVVRRRPSSPRSRARRCGRSRASAGESVTARDAARPLPARAAARGQARDGAPGRATSSSPRRCRRSRPTAPRCSALLADLGVRRVRFVDEPVAAALGYGISLSARAHACWSSTSAAARCTSCSSRLSPRGALERARRRVLAKQGRPLGGNAVDGWVLEALCARWA